MTEPLASLGRLGVVIPAYNAASVIGATVRQISRWLTDREVEHGIVVVDDGSRDSTGRTASEALQHCGSTGRVITHGVNRGKGAAVRTGMLACEGDWALFLDADHSTHIRHVERVAQAAAAGADVVIGSRRAPGADIACTRPRARQWLGDLFPRVTRAISGHGASDSQCGFKAVRRWAVSPVFSGLRTERFAFDVELLVRARRAGARVWEVPVCWDNPSQSTLRVARDGPSMMLDTLRIAWRLRRGSAESVGLERAGAEARRMAQDSARESRALVVEVRATDLTGVAP